MRLEFPAPFPDLCQTLHCLSTFTSACVCELGRLLACMCGVCCCREDTCCSRAFLPLFLVSVPDTLQYLSIPPCP
jgi:hypothetical protein